MARVRTSQWEGVALCLIKQNKKFVKTFIGRRSPKGLEISSRDHEPQQRRPTIRGRDSLAGACKAIVFARARALNRAAVRLDRRVVACPTAGGTRTSLMLRRRPTEHVCSKNHLEGTAGPTTTAAAVAAAATELPFFPEDSASGVRANRSAHSRLCLCDTRNPSEGSRHRC